MYVLIKFREDVEVAEGFSDAERQEFYMNMKSGAESGTPL